MAIANDDAKLSIEAFDAMRDLIDCAHTTERTKMSTRRHGVVRQQLTRDDTRFPFRHGVDTPCWGSAAGRGAIRSALRAATWAAKPGWQSSRSGVAVIKSHSPMGTPLS
jgi:hypothetical protein